MRYWYYIDKIILLNNSGLTRVLFCNNFFKLLKIAAKPSILVFAGVLDTPLKHTAEHEDSVEETFNFHAALINSFIQNG